MFVFDDNVSFLREEQEIKPNIYTARVLQIAVGVISLCLILNEYGVFHVDQMIMRVSCTLVILLAVIPQVIIFGGSRRFAGHPASKYLLLGFTCLLTLAVESALFVFSAPVCMLPMLLAVQYPSKKYCRTAIVAAALITGISPLLGCFLKLWNADFLTFLVGCAKGFRVSTEMAREMSQREALTRVLLFVSFPWLLCVVLLGRMVFSVACRNEKNLGEQVQARDKNRLDALTGLYNQNTYMELLKKDLTGGSAGVIFFDVDGLKEINDSGGHEQGDLLLRTCADSVKTVLDGQCRAFRTGGDEMVMLIDTEDPAEVDRKLAQWEKNMSLMNMKSKGERAGFVCSLSVGTAFGAKAELERVIREADSRMYEVKLRHHREGVVSVRIV